MLVTILRDERLPVNSWTDQLPTLLTQLGLDVASVEVDDLVQAIEGDYFCNAHGAYYPVDIEESLITFFGCGGGLLHVGGMPFSRPLQRRVGTWQPEVRTLGDIREHAGYGPLEDPLDVFPARLGLASYDLDHGSTRSELMQVFDERLVGAMPSENVALPLAGLLMNTSVPLVAARPDLRLLDHRAYQARPVSRANHQAGILCAPDGSKVGVSLLLTKFYANPYELTGPVPLPWAIFAGEPEGDVSGELLAGVVRWLQTPVFLGEPGLGVAAIHEGESTEAHVDIRGTLPDGWTARGSTAAWDLPELSGEKDPTWVLSDTKVTQGQDHGVVSVGLEFRPDAVVNAVEIELVDEVGRTRDVVTTGVVCVRPDDLMRGPRIQGDGRYLQVETDDHHQRSTFVVGVNWHDRELFAFTWDHPNGLRLAKDAAAMATAGMQVVRPHFYHPGWFPATAADVYGAGWPELYRDFYDGPELTEKHLRAFEAHVAAFSAAGIAFMPTIYTSVGANMGDPGHWIGTSRLFVLDDLIENQLRFARQIMERFGDCPGMIWDLDNEPDTALHDAGPWLERHREVWASTGHSVGVGTNWNVDSVRLGESADWHSVHGHIGPFPNKPAEFGSGKPCLFQESHNPGKATREGNEEVEINLDRAVCWTLRYGGAGFLPWGWAMGLMNWRYGGGWVEYWDYELGVGVHADGTPRRTLGRLQNWARLLGGLEFDQSPDRAVVFVYPKRFLAAKGIAEYIDVLAPAGYRLRAINDSEFAEADLGGARLVIFPHGAAGYRDESFERMRTFASEGGCVWAHNDTMICDEHGSLKGERPIPKPGGREAVGLGFIHWSLGWNTDRNPLNDSIPINLIPLVPLMEELGIRSLGTSIPLVDGGLIEFEERHSAGELSMSSAWESRVLLPPQWVVTALRVLNSNGDVVRGWTDGSEDLLIGGYRLHGDNDAVFALATEPGVVHVAGRRIAIDGPNLSETTVHLVRPFPNWSPAAAEVTARPPGAAIDMSGWRGRFWVQLSS